MHDRFHASYFGNDKRRHRAEIDREQADATYFRNLSRMIMLVPLLEGAIGRSNKLAWPALHTIKLR